MNMPTSITTTINFKKNVTPLIPLKSYLFIVHTVVCTVVYTVAQNFSLRNRSLLYRQECFTGKYTTSKIHTILHAGVAYEDNDDVIYRIFRFVCANKCRKIDSSI